MRSQVTGLSSLKYSLTPASLRAYEIASLIAKTTEAPKNNGGSPIACKCNAIIKLCTVHWKIFEVK